MDIPEIRLHIIQFLHTSHLIACANVCKTWNNFFTPHLYSEINRKNSTSPVLDRYCHHARKLALDLDHPVLERLLQWPVTGILELDLKGRYSYDPYIPQVLVSLLQRNPGVSKLAARQIKGPPLVALVSLCPNLRDLDIHDFEFRCYPSAPIDDNGSTPFWQMCQGLTRLTLSFNTLKSPPDTLLPPSRVLSNMRHLTFGASGSSVVDQLRLILACQNLETLYWSLMYAEYDDSGMDLDLIRDAFQYVGRLRAFSIVLPLRSPPTRQNWTALLIKILPALTGLNDVKQQLYGKTVGLVAGPLSRHFATLAYLSITGWRGVTIEDNHLILTSCSGLRTFKSTHYAIGEIDSLKSASLASSDCRSRSGLGPLGWVCTELALIELKFAHNTPEKSRLMFEQLCFMRKLEIVHLSGVKPGLIPAYIQWDDEASARHWPRGENRFYEIQTSMPWAYSVWPRLYTFKTWWESMVEELQAK